jgi:hypothetical protein
MPAIEGNFRSWARDEMTGLPPGRVWKLVSFRRTNGSAQTDLKLKRSAWDSNRQRMSSQSSGGRSDQSDGGDVVCSSRGPFVPKISGKLI